MAGQYKPSERVRVSVAWETPPDLSQTSTTSTPRGSSRILSRIKKALAIPVAWLLLLFTVIFFALTVLYAAQARLNLRLRITGSSASRAIFLLRALSEITSIFFAATIAAIFERIQWLLVVTERGTPLTEFLALQAGTGVLGLTQLIVSKGVGKTSARVWSLLRLCAIALVPVLGVLILSDVRNQLGFERVDSITLPLGIGLGPVNATAVGALAPLTDIMFGTVVPTFLLDDKWAIDVTPRDKLSKSCARGIDVEGGQTCERTVFLVAGIDQVSVDVVTVASHPQAGAWIADKNQGYVLSFGEGNRNVRFDDSECRTWHTEVMSTPIAAYYMCVKNEKEDEIEARIVSCPFANPLTQNCLEDQSWKSSEGWSASLHTTYRSAKVAYSRLNGTILSHQFVDGPRPAPVNASDILLSWDILLGTSDLIDSSLSQAIAIFGLGSGKYLFPGVISSTLNSYARMAADNPAADTRGVNTLHSLLAIPLYYGQTGYTERLAMTGTPSSVFVDERPSLNLTTGITRNTPLHLAVIHNELHIGRSTLLAYLILSLAALFACFVALCITSATQGGTMSSKRFPETTAFPGLDFCTNCVVRSEEGISTSRGPFYFLDGKDYRRDFGLLGEMRVERAETGDD